MQISINDASIENLNLINDLLRLSKSYWGYDKEFLDRFMAKFGITNDYMKKNTIKLFYVDDHLAGFYSFGTTDDKQCELDNLFLHPDYIGKGLGRKLWDTCCRTAIEQGIDEFILWGDPHAENFYLKMGCEKIGVRESPMMPNRYPPIMKFKIKK